MVQIRHITANKPHSDFGELAILQMMAKVILVDGKYAQFHHYLVYSDKIGTVIFKLPGAIILPLVSLC